MPARAARRQTLDFVAKHMERLLSLNNNNNPTTSSEQNKPGQKLIFLLGAGISVASGIPDFRSPGGMYDTLQPELLTATSEQQEEMKSDPTTVVHRRMFHKNQFPYLEVRRPFILGLQQQQWKPTLAHFFIRVCHDKHLLRRVFTQNIDGLDYCVGVPSDRLCSVHGSMGRVECEFCRAECDRKSFSDAVATNIKDIYGMDDSAPKQSSHVLCKKCKRPGLKPATVLYGSSLPNDFFDCKEEDCPDASICMVVGTSLTVQPASYVCEEVSDQCLRVLVNRDLVGPWQPEIVMYEEKRQVPDQALLGDCDQVFAELALRLGWLSELAVFEPDMAVESAKVLRKVMNAVKKTEQNVKEKEEERKKT